MSSTHTEQVRLPAASRGRRGPGPGAAPPSRRPSPRAVAWVRRAPLMPALVFMVIVTQLPFVATLVISFMNWNALYPDQRSFTGFGNYTHVFSDPDLRSSVLTTIWLTAS